MLCCGAVVFADRQVEPILRDLGLRMSTVTAYLTEYIYFTAACTFLFPIVADRYVTGCGIPLAVSMLAFLIADLFAQMCSYGCVHESHFDIVTFSTIGYGMVPVLVLLSAALWIRFFVNKAHKTLVKDPETPSGPAKATGAHSEPSSIPS